MGAAPQQAQAAQRPVVPQTSQPQTPSTLQDAALATAGRLAAKVSAEDVAKVGRTVGNAVMKAAQNPEVRKAVTKGVQHIAQGGFGQQRAI